MSDAQQLDQSRLVMRRFVESDLERLYALLSETPEVARTPDECSMEALTEQMSWPGHIPERDRWVVADRAAPERLLGYSSVFKPPTTPRADLLGVTHPEARGDGLYRPLLLHAIAWLAAQGMVDIRIESWGDSPAVLADYQALGFSVARRETLFRRALTSPR